MKKQSNLNNICLDAQKTHENKSKENLEKKEQRIRKKSFIQEKKPIKKRFSRINNQFFREISFFEKTE